MAAHEVSMPCAIWHKLRLGSHGNILMSDPSSQIYLIVVLNRLGLQSSGDRIDSSCHITSYSARSDRLQSRQRLVPRPPEVGGVGHNATIQERGCQVPACSKSVAEELCSRPQTTRNVADGTKQRMIRGLQLCARRVKRSCTESSHLQLVIRRSFVRMCLSAHLKF